MVCSFFGETKREQITPETENLLYDVFLWLITKKGIWTFLTHGNTDFEEVCLETLYKIKEKWFPSIEIKTIPPDYFMEDYENEPEPDFNGSFNLIKEEAKYVPLLNDRSYVLFDTIDMDGMTGNIFTNIITNYALREIHPTVLMLDKMKFTKRKKNDEK